jgi:hypothetical protein
MIGRPAITTGLMARARGRRATAPERPAVASVYARVYAVARENVGHSRGAI